jgi:hypothetical protein
MPAVLTVYRGVQNTDHAAGLNWTLHRPIAEHYATAREIGPQVLLTLRWP